MISETLYRNSNTDRKILAFIYTIVFFFNIIFNYYFRSSFFPGILSYINIFSILFIVMYFLKYYKLLNIRFILLLLMIVITFYSEKGNFIEFLQVVLTVILPLILYCFNIDFIKTLNLNIKKILIIFNVLMITTFVFMIVDYISQGDFFSKYSQFVTVYEPYGRKMLSNSQRIPSILGHQLITKTYFLLFFSFNELYNKYYEKFLLNRYLTLIISVVAILLTGSKTGVALLIILIMLFYSEVKNLPKLVFISIILFISYFFGVFDDVIERFTTTSLTTGRLEGLNEIKMSLPKIAFFKGTGDSFFKTLSMYYENRVITAAFEFSVLGFLYKYGIIFTIILNFFLFILPIKKMFLNKEFLKLITFSVFVVDINTFNQLLFSPDLVTMVILIGILFLSFNIENKKIEES